MRRTRFNTQGCQKPMREESLRLAIAFMPIPSNKTQKRPDHILSYYQSLAPFNPLREWKNKMIMLKGVTEREKKVTVIQTESIVTFLLLHSSLFLTSDSISRK